MREVILAIGYVFTKHARGDKAPLCAELGVTHFVDDRLDVLATLTTVEYRFLFTGGLGSARPDRTGRGVQAASDWDGLARLLRASVGDRRGPR